MWKYKRVIEEGIKKKLRGTSGGFFSKYGIPVDGDDLAENSYWGGVSICQHQRFLETGKNGKS